MFKKLVELLIIDPGFCAYFFSFQPGIAYKDLTFEDAARIGATYVMDMHPDWDCASRPYSVLKAAIEAGNEKSVKYLFQHKHAECTQQTVILAAKSNHIDIAKWLYKEIHPASRNALKIKMLSVHEKFAEWMWSYRE